MKTMIDPHSERYEAMLTDMTNVQYEWLFYRKPASKHPDAVGYLSALITDAKQLSTVGPIHRSRFMDEDENLKDNILGIPLTYTTQQVMSEADTHGIFFTSANPGTIAIMHIAYNELRLGLEPHSMSAICIMRALNKKNMLSAISVKQFNINNLLGMYSYGSHERFVMAIDGEVVSDRAAIGVSGKLINVKYSQTLYSKVDNCSSEFALGNYSDDEYKDNIHDLVSKGIA